eukprot:CAMPEP_0169451298 /NCGR_PEP_ID=MMETSP1042-20121227/13625_1 /TAXON_ID=464988 /ORGANISM="Hemiselmis andersenii, Strain CCMP1180" /LENGTH=156 /DNA_ID=CAMNT_0009563205 /DNA_START=1120 /DNA_END=1590 /DNA_ORIENTATION=+
MNNSLLGDPVDLFYPLGGGTAHETSHDRGKAFLEFLARNLAVLVFIKSAYQAINLSGVHAGVTSKVGGDLSGRERSVGVHVDAVEEMVRVLHPRAEARSRAFQEHVTSLAHYLVIEPGLGVDVAAIRRDPLREGHVPVEGVVGAGVELVDDLKITE